MVYLELVVPKDWHCISSLFPMETTSLIANVQHKLEAIDHVAVLKSIRESLRDFFPLAGYFAFVPESLRLFHLRAARPQGIKRGG